VRFYAIKRLKEKIIFELYDLSPQVAKAGLIKRVMMMMMMMMINDANNIHDTVGS
jgi:hypothetical protein